MISLSTPVSGEPGPAEVLPAFVLPQPATEVVGLADVTAILSVLINAEQ